MKEPLNLKLQLNSRKVVTEIVESGIEQGFNRAKEVLSSPSEQAIKEYVLSHVMIKLEEYISFD